MELATFPVWRVQNGACTCGDPSCGRAGKHPRYAWSQVRKGERIPGEPGDGEGICTGQRSGIFVLDVDGPEAAQALLALGPVPETYTVKTARGVHLYFRCPDFPVKTSGGALAKGLDIRGEGGFVVAPGSMHASGAVYTVLDAREPVEAPGWLLAWDGLKGKNSSENAAPIATCGPEHPDYARRLTLAEERCKTQEPNGGTANMWPLALYLVRTLELPQDVCVQLIRDVYSPRCDPPWSDTEILHKVISAREKGQRPTGAAPEGWAARIAAAPWEKAPEVRKDRQRPDENHEYKHKAYDAASTDCHKVPFNTMVQLLVTSEDWAGVWQWDEFSDRVFAVNPPMPLDAESGTVSESDTSIIRTWFLCLGILANNLRDVYLACVHAAKENPFNRVTDTYEDSDR